MSSKLVQTALKFIGAFETLSSETFRSLLAPTATHEFAPASLPPPPPKNPDEFVQHVEGIKTFLSGFPVYVKELFENEEKRQVTVWATSLMHVREELKDDGLSKEDWLYRGEYIFIFTMDESKEKIVRIIEFLDSKGTERAWELIARARKNMEALQATGDQ